MGRLRLFDLNDPQRHAVTTTDGPLLILAGAGTGKTRVITARIAYLVETAGVDPAQLLAVTFTNRAADEMRERVAASIGREKSRAMVLSTFHSLCVRILRNDIEPLGFRRNFTIYDQKDQLGLLKRLLTRISSKEGKIEPKLAQNLISRAKNSGRPDDIEGPAILEVLYERYRQELRTLNALDFDDLLLFAVELLRDHEEVRAKWQSRFSHLMIDEFQDTNRLQLDLVALLAGRHPNVCVVGDDDQSIYSWRGACLSNLLEFESHFPNPTVVRLEENYRSTTAILHTANSLIRNNPRRRPKQLWSRLGEGEPVKIAGARDEKKEAQFVVTAMQKLNREQSASWDQMAVLYRMNAQSRLFEEELRTREIPYRLVGGMSFYERREIRDLVAWLRVASNPGDDVSLLRIVGRPKRGIGDGTMQMALEHGIQKHLPVFEALRDPDFTSQFGGKTRRALEEFVELIDATETRLLEPGAAVADICQQFIEQTGYYRDLEKTSANAEEAESRKLNVTELLNSLDEFMAAGRGGLTDFLDRMTLEREEENPDAPAGVTLTTLHAAKGLEFPHVFLVGMEEGLLPHERSRGEGNLDEERRLLYVGITRAQKTLALVYPLQRTKFGTVHLTRRSSFIDELAEDYLEEIDADEWLNRPVEEATAKEGFSRLRAMLAQRQSAT